MMFSFQCSLSAIVLVFLWSPGLGEWQRRAANGIIRLLCGHGVLAGFGGSGKWGFLWFSARLWKEPSVLGERERNHGLLQMGKSGLFIAQPQLGGRRFTQFPRTGGSTTGSPPGDLGAEPPSRTRTAKRVLRVASVGSKDPHNQDEQNLYTQALSRHFF